MKKVTIKDIAKECKVSPATVSLVLNNKTKEIGENTVIKVRRVAKEMGYSRNEIARSLVTNSSETLAILVPDISNPFYGKIVQAISKEAAKRNYSILLCDTNNEVSEELHQINILDNRLIDGMIIASRNAEKLLKEYKNHRNVPIVILDENYISTDKNVYTITSNIEQTSYDMARYLMMKGHEHILTLTGTMGGTNSMLREKGMRKAFSEFGIEAAENQFILADYNLDKAYEIIMDTEPFSYTAVVCFNDMMAYGAIKALQEKGYRVPEDVAVVGFDSNATSNLVEAISKDRLTSFNQNEHLLATESIKMIFNHLDGKAELNKKRVLIDSTWVLGTTS